MFLEIQQNPKTCPHQIFILNIYWKPFIQIDFIRPQMWVVLIKNHMLLYINTNMWKNQPCRIVHTTDEEIPALEAVCRVLNSLYFCTKSNMNSLFSTFSTLRTHQVFTIYIHRSYLVKKILKNCKCRIYLLSFTIFSQTTINC